MNEQNRMRLDRIAARHASRTVQRPSEPEPKHDNEDGAAFLTAFDRVRDEVLRPVMAEVGVQLRGAGYLFRIGTGGDARSPAIELYVMLPDRGDSKDTIRFFAHDDAERGWQVIAELELKRTPVELTRFESIDEIAHDVVEQLVVDAVEQMFASVGALPQGEPPPAPSECAKPAVAVPTVEAIAAPPASIVPVLIREPKIGDDARGHFESMPPLGQPSGLDLLPLTDAPEERWARWAGPQPVVGETADVDIRMFRRRPLPFAAGAPPPAFFAAADAARAEVRDPRPSGTGHETMVLPAMTATAPRDKAEIGARDAVDTGLASLTVEQYAAFCAELALFPCEAINIHRKYGVAAPVARAALDDAFARQFHADPTLHRRWKALVDHYADWYRREAPR